MYYCEVKDAGGCMVRTDEVAIKIAPNPAEPTITPNVDTLVASKAQTYQWYFNNVPLDGETSRKLETEEKGEYKVRITDQNGCSSASKPLAFTPSAHERKKALLPRVRVYSNPNNGVFTVEISNIKQPLDVELLSPAGSKVFSQTLGAQADRFVKEFNVTTDGMYPLNVKTKDGQVSRVNVMVQRR